MIIQTQYQIYLLVSSLIFLPIFSVHAQQKRIVTGTFRDSPEILTRSLQLNCDNDGDKIKIMDILYKTINCGDSKVRARGPAANSNIQFIQQCTGKRTCVVPADYITKPFQPKPTSSCEESNKFQIEVEYSCVPQEEIRSMCETFTTQEYMGYLSTPSYPMLLQPGVPVAPCRCHLEAVPPTARISFTLLEYNLVSNLSDVDMLACQSEVDRQYLDVDHDGTHTYLLCGHKYNDQVPSSPTLDLTFENPIKREAGALWMQYTADEAQSMVKVSCFEPVVTTTAPKHYTDPTRKSVGGKKKLLGAVNYKLILGIVAAALFILVVIAILIITIKYSSRLSHYMIYKYSKRPPKGKRELRQDLSPTYDGNCIKTYANGYQETHFDSVDETTLCGKPTAHINPQLSVSERLNKFSEPDLKNQKEREKYLPLASTYLSPRTSESDSERSEGSLSKHSERSNHSPTSETSSAPSVRRALPPNMTRQKLDSRAVSEPRSPKYEDIWVRVNSPKSTLARRVSLGSQSESDRLLMGRPPPISFNTGSRPVLPDAVPMMHRVHDSRESSDDDEEMDIKFVNPNLMSPRKTPVQAVKPAIKYAVPPHSATPRSDSVTFADLVYQSSHSPEHRQAEAEPKRKPKLKAAISQNLPSSASKMPPASTRFITNKEPPRSPKLMVDMGNSGQKRSSRSLPNYGHRMNSSPALSSHSHSTKRPKRKCASDNDRASSSSSQEQLYSTHASPHQVPKHRSPRTYNPNGSLRKNMTHRGQMLENDEQLSRPETHLDMRPM